MSLYWYRVNWGNRDKFHSSTFASRILFKILFIYLTVLGLSCPDGISLSFFFFFWLCWVFTPSCGFSLLLRCSASHRGGFSCCGARALECMGSVVVVHGLSRATACGTLLEQGLNLCPLHWWADSLPLSHHGSLKGLCWKSRKTPWRKCHLEQLIYE